MSQGVWFWFDICVDLKKHKRLKQKQDFLIRSLRTKIEDLNIKLRKEKREKKKES